MNIINIMLLVSTIQNKTEFLMANPITDQINKWSNELADIGKAVAVIAMIACAVVLMLGEKMSQTAKKWLLLIIAAIALIVNAPSIVSWLISL